LDLNAVNRLSALLFNWRSGFKRMVAQCAATGARGKAIFTCHWHHTV